MRPDWTNQEPTPPLPKGFWAKVAFWVVAAIPFGIVAALILAEVFLI